MRLPGVERSQPLRRKHTEHSAHPLLSQSLLPGLGFIIHRSVMPCPWLVDCRTIIPPVPTSKLFRGCTVWCKYPFHATKSGFYYPYGLFGHHRCGQVKRGRGSLTKHGESFSTWNNAENLWSPEQNRPRRTIVIYKDKTIPGLDPSRFTCNPLHTSSIATSSPHRVQARQDTCHTEPPSPRQTTTRHTPQPYPH